MAVPGPKLEEYFDAMYRHLYLQNDTFFSLEKLDSLATAFKTNNISLRESLAILAKELNAKEFSIEQDEYIMGGKAIELLIERINNPDTPRKIEMVKTNIIFSEMISEVSHGIK